jgi:trigger factor
MMKKSLKVCMWGLAAVMMVSGCSKKAESTPETTPAVTDASVETTGDSSDETGTEAQAQEPPVLVDPGKVEKLGDYKGVTFTPLSTEVTDQDVEDRIQSLIAAYPEYQEVERAAQEGDVVNIDYVGKKDGVAFEGGTGEGYDLTLGSGQFIDGFEDGLIGAVKGQELNLDLTFPEQYHSEELAGQAVVFEVKVNEVKEQVEPELNDAFIAEHTDSATVEEYRKAVWEEMEQMALSNADNQKKSDVFLKVIDDSEVTTPEESIQTTFEQQKSSYEQQAQMFGIDLDTLVSYYGMDLESFESELMELAKEICKQNAVVKAIAEAENITVEDSDREALAEEFGYPDVDTMIENAGADNVDNYIQTEKVVQFIADNAVEE